jgi:hypothetical protein
MITIVIIIVIPETLSVILKQEMNLTSKFQWQNIYRLHLHNYHRCHQTEQTSRAPLNTQRAIKKEENRFNLEEAIKHCFLN